MSSRPLFANGWEVTGIRSAEEFFLALSEVLPLPVRLCFEGTSICSEVQALLVSNGVAPTLSIPPGTIRPKPDVFHVQATEQVLQQLAVLARRHAEPEFCDHFHAYSDSQGLMQWYDAFDLPLLVSETISETNVRAFCGRLGVRYSRWRAEK
jgi:hypothetical protein